MFFVDYNTEGYFFRALYDYDAKYYFSASYRRDASSRFHPDHWWGIYLRWIDRHGFYQYWLFQIGDNILQVSTNGELLYQTFSDNKYAYYGVSRQSKKMQKSIKACATLIDQDTFDMLSTLHTSPLIDLYHEGKWFPVRLATGTVNHLRKPLQDFEIEIMLPEIISQIL